MASQRTTRRGSVHRYDGGQDAVLVSVARGVPSLNVRHGLAAVPDPYPNPTRDPKLPRERLLVTVNQRVDILEDDLSRKRISAGAYAVGRLLQGIYERSNGSRTGATTWEMKDRGDAAYAHEAAIIRSLENAGDAVHYSALVAKFVGLADAQLVRLVLCERCSFASIAAAKGAPGERGAWYYARRFRDALEELATAQEKGKLK